MTKQTRVPHPIANLLPADIKGFDVLAELALDMRWSWNHVTDEVWRQLDPDLWENTHNPWVVLQTASRDRIEHALADPAFRKHVDGLVKTTRQGSAAPAWFQRTHSESQLTRVAYFSIPTSWVRRMRESMARLTPRFSKNRSVREYTEQHYLPVAAAYRARAAEKGALGRSIVDWEHVLKEDWGSLRFGDVKVNTEKALHVFEVEVYFTAIDPNAVRVELYADGIDGGGPIRQEMTSVQRPSGEPPRWIYRASVSATRPATDYPARVIPHYPGVAVPLEAAPILWQR